MSKTSTGVEVRHARSCPLGSGPEARCRCEPTYRAWAYDAREGKKIRRSFPTLAAAKAWRADATGDVRRGKLRAVPAVSLREAAAAWIEGVESGTIRNRSGHPFKPSTIRGYRAALTLHVLPDLGAVKLGDVQLRDLQDLADRLLASGRDPSTVRNALMPLRAIFRRALSRGEVAVNPTSGLELPAVQGRRDRIAPPADAAGLIEALKEDDRPLWATAFYAGLRRGELGGLRWEDVDLGAGVIRVERAFDFKCRVVVEPKSRAGRRSVPIPAVLRGYLAPFRLRSGRRDGDLVFGRTASSPFDASVVAGRAGDAWEAMNEKRREAEQHEIEAITLHEARHTFASLMIAAGVNAKALSSYMGHASIAITLDRYGHLMPGAEAEAASRLDAYLEAQADTR